MLIARGIVAGTTDDDIESAILDDNRISRIADELNIVANQNVSALAPCEDVGAGATVEDIVPSPPTQTAVKISRYPIKKWISFVGNLFVQVIHLIITIAAPQRVIAITTT